MTLIIKDQETDRLVRELAELTGIDPAEAVKAAIVDRLAVEKQRQRQGGRIDMAAVKRITDRIAAMPDVDTRSPDEIIGYDERGLPS